MINEILKAAEETGILVNGKINYRDFVPTEIIWNNYTVEELQSFVKYIKKNSPTEEQFKVWFDNLKSPLYFDIPEKGSDFQLFEITPIRFWNKQEYYSKLMEFDYYEAYTKNHPNQSITTNTLNFALNNELITQDDYNNLKKYVDDEINVF